MSSPAMRTHVAKWGNSLAVRLPKPVADALALEPGSMLEFELRPGQIVLSLARPRYDLKALVAKINDRNLPRLEGDLPQGGEIL